MDNDTRRRELFPLTRLFRIERHELVPCMHTIQWIHSYSVHSMILTLSCIFSLASATVCPINWSYFDGLCWKFNQSPMSFDESEKECRAESGDLVSPRGDSNNQWISILTTPFVSLPYKPDCFERDMAPAWIAPRLASHLKVSTVQECLSICSSSQSLLDLSCPRLVYDNLSQGCLLLGSSPGEGDKMAMDPSFEAYNNLCWLQETTKNEVSFPDEFEPEIEISPDVNGEMEELKKNLIAMKQIDSDPTTVIPIAIAVPTVIIEPAFKPEITVPNEELRKCFRRIPLGTIPGRADDIYQNITTTECLRKCMECDDCLYDDLPCMSVVFYENLSECVLLRVKAVEGLSRVSSIEDGSTLFWRDKECNSSQPCKPHMDLIFLLDGSDSIGIEDFQRGLKVVQNVIESIRKMTGDARIRVVQVGEGMREDFPLSPLQEDTATNVGQIDWIGGRSLLGSSVSQVMKNTRSESATFILISDLFIEDNTKLIELELEKSNKDLITLSLTETADRKMGDRLTREDPSKMIRANSEEEAEERLLNLLCGNRKRTKRQTNTLESRRVWIGLRRNEDGDLRWSDQTTISDLSRLVDRPTEVKKCVSSERNWNYTECETELPFICTFKPVEKLESLIQRSFTITSLHMPQ